MNARQDTNTLIVLGTAAAMFAVATALCIVLARNGHPEHAMLGGVLVLVGAGVSVLRFLPAQQRGSERQDPALLSRVDEIADSVREIAAHSALSPDARRVLFRSQERDVVAQAVETEIARREWSAALMLVREMEDRLGYVEHARVLRERIEEARSRPAGSAAQAPLPAPDTHAPDDAYRRQRREELELRFTQAAERGEAHEALEVLKELDTYLTPEEAEPLREVARNIIAKARDAMGERFKSAVQEKRWSEAAGLGERIMREFPNTRMASEVRDMIDALRAKAQRETPSPTGS